MDRYDERDEKFNASKMKIVYDEVFYYNMAWLLNTFSIISNIQGLFAQTLLLCFINKNMFINVLLKRIIEEKYE